MFPDLKGRGLFVFSDPGGAKPLLALITLLKPLTACRIISDRDYSFFADFNLDVERYEAGMEQSVIENFSPNFLFAGTSYTSKIELKFIQEAKNRQVSSYSFIDHYTKFEDRFLLDNHYIFPDHICVIDEKAKNIGLETALPKDRFLITGNFYHQWLQNWKPAISRKVFLGLLNIPLQNKLFVYAPDPVTNIGGIEKYGLDEASVLKNILVALEMQTKLPYTLLIKMHPNQNKGILNDLIPKNDCRYIVANDAINTNSLLYYSDLIIGIISNILIEGAIMHKKVLRCLIGFKNTDPLESNNIGTAVYNIDDLKNELGLILS
jgi:hypothetical protein